MALEGEQPSGGLLEVIRLARDCVGSDQASREQQLGVSRLAEGDSWGPSHWHWGQLGSIRWEGRAVGGQQISRGAVGGEQGGERWQLGATRLARGFGGDQVGRGWRLRAIRPAGSSWGPGGNQTGRGGSWEQSGQCVWGSWGQSRQKEGQLGMNRLEG